MISKSQIKLITSLQQKKYRSKTGLFVAEGAKIVGDLLDSGVKLHSLYATDEGRVSGQECIQVSTADMQRMSGLKSASSTLAVFHMPEPKPNPKEGLILALDAVRDPGNLGTIIRLCDWFGVSHLICGTQTVDCYNPKVVQATMGSIARVSLSYTDLGEYLEATDLPVFAAVMDGENVYQSDLPEDAILVMGNEANGISAELISAIKNKITIPNFGQAVTAESLNVATATAILLSEFRRK
ncbi:MAG: RNA methyltransferase [Bacteroidota bacterium]